MYFPDVQKHVQNSKDYSLSVHIFLSLSKLLRIILFKFYTLIVLVISHTNNYNFLNL